MTANSIIENMKTLFYKNLLFVIFCTSCSAQDREYIDLRDFTLYKDTFLNKTISVAAVIRSSARCTLPGNKDYYCLGVTGNNSFEYFLINSDNSSIKEIIDWRKNNIPLKLIGKVEMMDEIHGSGQISKSPTLVVSSIIPFEFEEKISAPFKIRWKPILDSVLYNPYLDNDVVHNPMDSLVSYNTEDIFVKNNIVSIWVKFELKNPTFIKKGPIKTIFLRYNLSCEIDINGDNKQRRIVTASFLKPNEDEILFSQFEEKDVENTRPFALYGKLRKVTEGYCEK
jgi:hypothetical protein